MAELKPVRCAIYTRKSSDEGLEQAFNSLDAQREACAAYVASQKHEGWTLLPTVHDDGGYSGGNMDRPGLKALLALVEAGEVDVIIVYKVDRLTRSLADFARIVDVLDRRGASFVSITQAFNTTTSMGRLTLNVLLSFAQFEREVTGERIRDKIAASKAKGMWMGGNVPLGYRVEDRRLMIVEEEAEQVRRLFQLYLRRKAVDPVVEQAFKEGIRTRAGARLTRSSLYRLLANPTYAGLVGHKGAHHPGQHDAIIDDRTWAATTALLDKQRRRAKGTPAKAHGALLGGKVTDALGQRLTTTHTISRGRRYDYYAQAQSSPSQTALRVPAAALDTLVVEHLAERLGSPAHVVADYPNAPDLGLLIQKASDIVAALRSESTVTPTIKELVQRVVLATDHVEVILAPEVLGCGVTKAGCRIDSRIGRTKTGLKLVVGCGPEPEVDQSLIRRIALARSWYEELSTGMATIESIAARYRMTTNTVSGILPLAFSTSADVSLALGRC